MPDRIIRDEILESERWLGVDNLAKLAFLACTLRCDAVGNLDAQPIRLLRLWRDFGAASADQAEAVLRDLEAADLVRIYLVGEKRFVHIPRFGQRVRYVGRLHPASPWDQQKQSPAKKSPGDGQVSAELAPGADQVSTGRSPVEVKRSEVKRSEVKRSNPADTEHAREGERALTSKPFEKMLEVKTETATPKAATEQIAKLTEKLRKPQSTERPRSKAEQIAFVQAALAKGRQ